MSNIVEYKSKNTDIVFLMVDYTSKINNDWTRELVKNLSDFVLSNIVQKGYTVLQGINEKELLDSAKGYKHAVVFATGTEFTNGSKFFEALEEAVKKEYFLQGHIPDRGEGYYQLHEQCYFINLEIYRELESPEIGEFSFYNEHTQIKPLRSKQNIHDDYTPIWIKPGNKEQHYIHKWHGWNILSIAFQHNLPVLIFDESIRDNKQYYYAEYQESFDLAQEYMYGKQTVSTQPLFYPLNTEEVTELDVEVIHQLVTQASGLNWIDLLLKNGYDENTTVTFVDNNFFALECMHFITQWNGKNYPDMINKFTNFKTRFADFTMSKKLTMNANEIQNQWDKFLTKHPNWEDTWDLIKARVEFKFIHADLVLNRSLPVNVWLEDCQNTVVHLSHIFNYDPVAPFTPLKLRIDNENNLIQRIAEHCPTAKIVFDKRSAEGYIDSSYIDSAENMDLINKGNLKLPTWHYGDWS